MGPEKVQRRGDGAGGGEGGGGGLGLGNRQDFNSFLKMSLCFCSRPSSPTVMRMHQWRIQAITNVLSTLDGGGRDASQGGSNLRSKVASVRQSCTGCARRGKGYDTYKPTKGCHCRDIPYTYDVSYSYNTIYHIATMQTCAHAWHVYPLYIYTVKYHLGCLEMVPEVGIVCI